MLLFNLTTTIDNTLNLIHATLLVTRSITISFTIQKYIHMTVFLPSTQHSVTIPLTLHYSYNVSSKLHLTRQKINNLTNWTDGAHPVNPWAPPTFHHCTAKIIQVIYCLYANITLIDSSDVTIQAVFSSSVVCRRMTSLSMLHMYCCPLPLLTASALTRLHGSYNLNNCLVKTANQMLKTCKWV